MSRLSVNLLIQARDQASRVVRGLTQRMGGLRTAVAAAGAAFAAHFSVKQISGFFRGAVSEAADLEQQLSSVRAVTGASVPDMERLKDAALDMGATTKFTATEAAQAMEELGRMGANTAQTIDALPGVLSLAAANGLGLADAAQMIAGGLNSMSLEWSEANRVADVFTATAANAGTDVTQLYDAFSYAAPMANAMGLELESLAAILGVTADGTITATRAGTAWANILGQFHNPASRFRSELRAIGIDTDDVVEAMYQLSDAGAAGEAAIVAIGANAGPALRTMLNQGRGSLEQLRDTLYDAEGAADAAAKTMADNLKGAITSLESAWSSLKVYMGDAFLDRIRAQVEDMTEAIRNAVSSGALDNLRDRFVDAFDSAVNAVRDFLGSFESVDSVIDAFTEKVSAAINFLERLGAAGGIAGQAIIAAFKVVDSAVSAVGTVIASVLYNILRGTDAIVQGLNRIGLVADSVVLKSEAMLETMDELADQLADRTRTSAREAGEAIAAMGGHIARLGELGKEVKDPVEQLAQSAGMTREEFEAWREENEKLEETLESIEDSLWELREAVEAARDKVEALKNEGADTDAIREATEELDAAYKALGDATLEADDARAALNDSEREGAKTQADLRAEMEATEAAAKALEEAYESLGMTSPRALQETADKAREAYHVIRDSGAPVDYLREAFSRYAQAAVAANNGVVDSALRTEAAAHGLKLEIDEAGRVAVVAMHQAAVATEAVGESARRTAHDYRGVAAGAKEAAQAVQELEKTERRRSVAKALDAAKMADARSVEELLALRQQMEADFDRYARDPRIMAKDIGGARDWTDRQQAAIDEALRLKRLQEISSEQEMLSLRERAADLGVRSVGIEKERLQVLIAEAELEKAREESLQRQAESLERINSLERTRAQTSSDSLLRLLEAEEMRA